MTFSTRPTVQPAHSTAFRALRGAAVFMAATGALSAASSFAAQTPAASPAEPITVARLSMQQRWQSWGSTSTSSLTTTAATTTAPVTSLASGRVVPSPMYGVTIDDVSGLSKITTSLSKLSKRPTARIVFDEYVEPAYYRKPVVEISKVSYVMGEILDSFYVPTVTVPGYVDRTRKYLNALSDVVDIWEIGNEMNGEWLGKNADVVAKMTGAYDLVESQNKATALTLYYNQDCWERKSNEMFTWANANVPSRMKQGLDYVLISYYEEDCNGLKPNWQSVFDKLAVMFPNSKIGFGEVGTSRSRKKVEYLNRYYTMKITTPRYVGGHFWWYFRQDMVPYTKDLWTTLNTAISGQ